MNYSNSQRAGVILYLTALLFGGYDLKVAYGKDGLDVRVCVMNIEFHIALHTENVHISVDKIGSCRNM